MTKLKYLFISVLCAFTLISCTSELTLQLNKNGSVDIKFVAGAGEAFTQLILAASDGDSVAVFDVDEITYQLGKSGFSKIKVETKSATDIMISMTDLQKKSYLFTSGICNVSQNGTKLSINLDSKKLMKFYSEADETLQMVLDLLLAPVFNDEKMEENEYLEVISSFYGSSASEEIQFSNLKLNVINADDSKVSVKIPLAELLTFTKPMSVN